MNSQGTFPQPLAYDNLGAEFFNERTSYVPGSELNPPQVPPFASLAASYNAPQIYAQPYTSPPGIGYPYPPPITPGTPAFSRQTVYIEPHGLVQYNSGYLGQPAMMGAQLPTPQHFVPVIGPVAVVGPPQYGYVNKFILGGHNHLCQ